MKIKIILISFAVLLVAACRPSSKRTSEPETLVTNASAAGLGIELSLTKGKEFNHPLVAIWLETPSGQYIQTLYVSQSIATGFFAHADNTGERWKPGSRRRPAALPYWSHKRNVKEADGLYVPTPATAMPDAYTGPTPLKSFVLKSKSDSMLINEFVVVLEINQCFDFNRTWTTTRFPNDYQYATSGQPSLIYSSGTINPSKLESEYNLRLIGHGNPSGTDGNLFPDISGFTSALEIVGEAKVKVIL